ncbi:error-prone DNA polymerase [Sphingorhabdus sp.]|jgi:error-prone DNA polymerase|uniref:error-prone DNA polymerase n=1 Tax=Sphingorhabdus sp. TaxID=1902408 RepID=UPI0037C973CA
MTPCFVYAELVAATNYSFLRGASHPTDMVLQAAALGLNAIGIADRNSVAGVVRAWVAVKKAKAKNALPHNFRLVTGSRLVFADGTPDIVVYPKNRKGWGRLTRLLTVGNMRANKGGCILHFDDLAGYLEDLLLIILPQSTAEETNPHKKPVAYSHADGDEKLRLVETTPTDLDAVMRRLTKLAPDRVWLGIMMHGRGKDQRRLEEQRARAKQCGVPILAVNDALYADAAARPLHDVLTAIRLGVSVDQAGTRLEVNAERYLKSPADMTRLFAHAPEAIAESQKLLDQITFDLSQLKYEYPNEPVPDGWEPQDWLEHLVRSEAERRHPDGLPPKWVSALDEEFTLVRRKNYACYFLTVHDIVQFARSQDPPILCQGRGSAANSVICYLLGITSVDPVANNLLFSRFLSEERDEPPDIDVDFEHERREEVMQYVYRRFKRHRAGIAATVIHYRPRSTVREVGKAIGLTEDVTARLAGTVWGSFGRDLPEARLIEAGFDPDNPQIARLHAFVGQLLDFPRHLSQHVGGYVLTENRLDETVPIHNGAMADRTFIEWDKDDIDALNLLKVDILALGMLTCIRKSFEMLRQTGGGDYSLDSVPAEDPAVYAMLQKGDSIGTFQVESRAQINMLPRLKPKKFYDLVIQIAIVRPGPIEGDMVHPYLRRRNGEEKVEYPSPAPPHDPKELHDILYRTFGVPLFQEQAMKLAMVAAAFTPDEANGLRRAMATFRNSGTMPQYKDKMINGMVQRGYQQDFAERCYKQIEGFGSYGFPESHAQAFAHLVYISSWLKCHHPAIFTAALLNSQPMGFYAPAQLVQDARRHKVDVRTIDVNFSNWDNAIEAGALRLGFRQIGGFQQDWALGIEAARPFASLEELARKAKLPPRALHLLADADALRSLGLDRREGGWEARRTPSDELPLFAAADARELAQEAEIALPIMPVSEHVAADYHMTRLSLKGHPVAFLRDLFAAEGILTCAQTDAAKHGTRVKTAGVVLTRQRPGKGNAIFITIEDETGTTNALLWSRLFERQRRAVMASRLMVIEGEVQRSKEGVVHLMATTIIDRSHELERLSHDHDVNVPLSRSDEFAQPVYPRHGHPRDVRILPKSRDFH